MAAELKSKRTTFDPRRPTDVYAATKAFPILERLDPPEVLMRHKRNLLLFCALMVFAALTHPNIGEFRALIISGNLTQPGGVHIFIGLVWLYQLSVYTLCLKRSYASKEFTPRTPESFFRSMALARMILQLNKGHLPDGDVYQRAADLKARPLQQAYVPGEPVVYGVDRRRLVELYPQWREWRGQFERAERGQLTFTFVPTADDFTYFTRQSNQYRTSTWYEKMEYHMPIWFACVAALGYGWFIYSSAM